MARNRISDSVYRNCAGQGLVEIVVISVLIAIVILGGMKLFGRGVLCQFSSLTSQIDYGSEGVEGCPAPVEESAEDSVSSGAPPPPPPPPPPKPSPPPTQQPTPVPTDLPCPNKGGICGYVTENWQCIPSYTQSCRMPPSVEPANCNKCCSGKYSDGSQSFGYSCGKTAGSPCTCY